VSVLATPSCYGQDWAQKMFKITEHDFGSVAKGGKAEFSFVFENLYMEDVHVVGLRASCGCTTPRVENALIKTYEKGAIVAHFNTDTFLGQRGATLYVTFDRPFPAEIQLHVRGYIRNDVVLEPGSLEVGSVDQGAPVEGIGLQSHFPTRLTGMDDLEKRLARFASFGKEMEVTEFDINSTDEATQADYTRDFMTEMFSQPQVKAFVMWGFWEGAHWRPQGAMFRRDWSLKPNGEVYKDLVFKKWWTNADGKTNGQGTYATRGFLGDYEIEVKAGNKAKTVKATLTKEGAKADVVLD